MRRHVLLLTLSVVALVSLTFAISRQFELENARREHVEAVANDVPAKSDVIAALTSNQLKLGEEITRLSVALAEIRSAGQARDAAARLSSEKLAKWAVDLERLATTVTQLTAQIEATKATAAALKELQDSTKTVVSTLKQHEAAWEAEKSRRAEEAAAAATAANEPPVWKAAITRLEQLVSEQVEALKALRLELDEVTQAGQQTMARLDKLEPQVARAVRPAETKGAPERRTPAPVHATVRVADATGGVAVISAGTKQGLQKGDILWVLRGGAYVARVEVDMLEDGLAGVRLLEAAAGKSIESGDSVTSERPADAPEAPEAPTPELQPKKRPPPPPTLPDEQ